MASKLFLSLSVLAISACASAGTNSGVHRDYNLITESEITQQNGNDAYDVISHLRPNFLKTRGRTSIQTPPSPTSEYASVFLDSQYYGDLNTLRNIPTINIKEIRYLPANEAVTRYGMQYGNGVIEIRTR